MPQGFHQNNLKDLTKFEFTHFSFINFALSPTLATLLKFSKSKAFFIIALICALIALSTYPVLGSIVQENRWYLAGFAGIVGALIYIKGAHSIAPDLRKYCNYSNALVAWCFICTILAGRPEDSTMRSVAFALLLCYGVLGMTAWCSHLSGILGCFLCISLFIFLLLGSAIIPSFEQTYNFGDESWRYQGSSSLKATGSATSINLALPLVALLFKYKPMLRPFIGMVFIFLCVTLLATKTRTGIVTLMCVIPAIYSFIKGEQINRVFIYSILIILIGAVILLTSESLQYGLRFKKGDNELNITGGRAERWSNIYVQSLNKPIIGHGIGQSNYHHISIEDRKRGLVTGIIEKKSVAHNQHLSVLYEFGVPGLILFWLMTAKTIKAGFQIWKNKMKYPFGILYRDILCASFIIWGILFVDTFSHNGLFTVGNLKTFIYWMLATLLICGNSYRPFINTISSSVDLSIQKGSVGSS